MTGNIEHKSEDEPVRELISKSPGSSTRLCPKCGQVEMDYDGLLNLVCPVCNHVEGGCFT